MKKIMIGLLCLSVFNASAQKISELPTATGNGTGVTMAVVQGGVTKKMQVDSIYRKSDNAINFVRTYGNDASAVKGIQWLPYLTINAALISLPAGGGIVDVGIGTFESPSVNNTKPNVWLKCSGMPTFNNTITAGVYPNYTSTYPTALVGGTILKGFLSWNKPGFYATDFGVDCYDRPGDDGFAVTDFTGAENGGENANGHTTLKNIKIKNVSILKVDGTTLKHGMVLEKCYMPEVDNVEIWGGFAGFVAKTLGGSFSNIKTHASATAGIFLKVNVYSYGYMMKLDGFEIDGGAGVILQAEDGDGGAGLSNINVTNGCVHNATHGIKGIGNISHCSISNVQIRDITGNGIDLPVFYRSRLTNCYVVLCSGFGLSTTGAFRTIVSSCYIDANTGTDLIVSGNSSGNELKLVGNFYGTSTIGANVIISG